MTKHFACISFDFDAMSGMVARGLKTPTPVSRGEFGAVAIPRILGLLQRHDVKASFFIPGTVIGTYPRECEMIVAAGHEIGNHGWTHIPPANLSVEQEEEGFTRSNEAIQKLTGNTPLGYRSPSWDLSTHTVELLIKHGFFYESSMMGHDHSPYRIRVGDVIHDDRPIEFGQPTSLIEMPISWSLDDFPHFEYLRMGQSVAPGLMNANSVLENWLADFNYMTQTESFGILTYTCHPFVIGRGHRMLMLEQLLHGLTKMNAEFLTMAQAAQRYDTREPFKS